MVKILKKLALVGAFFGALQAIGLSAGPLHEAAKEGNLKLIKQLVGSGADVNAKTDNLKYSPLHYAADEGYSGIVNYLLDNGADPEVKDYAGKTPLHIASQVGYRKVAELLLEHGAKVDEKDNTGWTPLHYAVNDGHLEIVELLVDAKAKVNEKDDYGWTPLHRATNRAAKNGPLGIVKYLVEHGAKVDEKNERDETALHLAVHSGRLDIVKLLLEHGAKVDEKDNTGWTPLHLGARYGYLNIVKLLLEHGANVDKKDDYGWTPLHYAAYQDEQLEMVRYLVEHGARVDVKNNDGKTALQKAKDKECRDYLELAEDFYKVVAANMTLETFIDKYLSEQDKAQLNKNIVYIRGLLLFGNKVIADGLYEWCQKNNLSLQSDQFKQWDWGLPGVYFKNFINSWNNPERQGYWYKLADENAPQDFSPSSKEYKKRLDKTLEKPYYDSLRKQLSLPNQLKANLKFKDINIKFAQ